TLPTTALSTCCHQQASQLDRHTKYKAYRTSALAETAFGHPQKKEICQPLDYIFRYSRQPLPTASCLLPPPPRQLILSFMHTMYTYKLALLLLVNWGATVAYAYPSASINPPSLALVAARSEHTLPSSPMAMPSPSTSYPVTNTAEHDPHSESMPRSIDDLDAAIPKHADDHKHKRQIHNADYHANAPPPSPNAAPAPAQESSAPSPANPPAATPSAPASKTKRGANHFGPGPVVQKRPSSSCEDDGEDQVGVNVKEHRVAMKRSENGSEDAFGGNIVDHHHTLSSRMLNGWTGVRRRNVEERTNVNNPNFDHGAITRWSRAEVDRMQAWSKLNAES
ncbi:hypothetical protein C8R44DRAFT_905479, partial [Mycena epipterygia]